MSGLYVTINLEKIAHNARTITRLCMQYGIAVTGVTKGTCGLPAVAQAMLRGGVTAIGESRMPNIHRLKASGVHTSYMLLRLPPLSEVDDVVTGVDISLNSELTVIAALSEAACRRGLVHCIIMVDLGDLREGVWPDDLISLVRDVVGLPGIRLANSAAIFDLPEAHFDAARSGIAIYGLPPSRTMANPRVNELKPVLEWKTRITYLKEVSAGTGLSYGHTFHTTKPSLIATIPAGYGDGLSQRLSNHLEVLVGGRRCSQVGQICMGQSLVDVTT
jgi:alanine racemase